MKAYILIILFFLQIPTWAEGFASMTMVTPENQEKLAHHNLRVTRNSHDGTSYISILVKAEKEHPLRSVDVTIFDKDGKKALVNFELRPDGNSNPIGFHVADALVDKIQLRYFLHANRFQSHLVTIEAGKLNWVVTP